jgi:hypothetical protein
MTLRMAAVREANRPDEQLVNLFRNRAQLKKAYLELQREYGALQDRLRNAEASTRRAEERLEAVEQLMAKPEAGYSGLVYFQLRSLWRTCREQLRAFADELRRQQDDRERRKQIERFNQDRSKRLDDVLELLQRVKVEADRIGDEIAGLEADLARRWGFWNLFKRRGIRAEIAARSDERSAVRLRIEELFDRKIRIESEPWPEFPGLSIEGRRAINVAVIAYACLLVDHFSENDLARLAKDAVTRPIQDHKYGSEQDCAYLIKRIEALVQGLQSRAELAVSLRDMSMEIRRAAEYRSREETVPVAGSMDAIGISANVSGKKGAVKLNVLTEEYWDLYDVFLG